MPKPNLFNDNANRTFPFKQGSAGIDTPASGAVLMGQLPDDFIIDCGFIMGPESGFVEGEHTVFLYKVSRVSASRVLYEFRSDAPELADIPLIFTRDINDDTYATEFLESDIPEYVPLSQSESLSQSASAADVSCGEPFWSGYLVTGPMTSVTDRLGTGDVVTRADSSETLVEPALIQNLNENQVVSLNIANADRTRALRPADYPQNEWEFATGEIYVNHECLQGDIKLRSGYNVAFNQINLTNTIQISAIVNAGQGEPCEEVKLFSTETPPIDSDNGLLAGDFYCNEVLRSVNGIAGPNLTIFAGSGVSIIADNATSTVVIDVNLVDLSLCTFSAVSESI